MTAILEQWFTRHRRLKNIHRFHSACIAFSSSLTSSISKSSSSRSKSDQDVKPYSEIGYLAMASKRRGPQGRHERPSMLPLSSSTLEERRGRVPRAPSGSRARGVFWGESLNASGTREAVRDARIGERSVLTGIGPSMDAVSRAAARYVS